MAEIIRGILVNEQEHQIDLATALGLNVNDVTAPAEKGLSASIGPKGGTGFQPVPNHCHERDTRIAELAQRWHRLPAGAKLPEFSWP